MTIFLTFLTSFFCLMRKTLIFFSFAEKILIDCTILLVVPLYMFNDKVYQKKVS